jgi:group I intron endonuclease
MRIIDQNILNYRYVIYKITNSVNNKVYIGKTICTLCSRINKHKYDSIRKNSYLYTAIRKYGWDCFSCNILEKCVDRGHLNEREIYWIDLYDSTNKKNGYNLHPGGTGGSCYHKLTKEQQKAYGAKISSKNTGKHIHDEEWKIMMSKKMKGRVITKETKERIADALRDGYKTGRIKKPTTLPPSMKGKKHTEQAKSRMSQSHKGVTWNEKYTQQDILHRIQILKERHKKQCKYITKQEVIRAIQMLDMPTAKTVSYLLKVSTTTLWLRLKEQGCTIGALIKEYTCAKK